MDLIKLLDKVNEKCASSRPSIDPLKKYFASLNDGVREISLYPAIDMVADQLRGVIKAELDFPVEGSSAIKDKSSEIARGLVKRGFFQTEGGAFNFVEAVAETLITQIKRGEETVIAIGRIAHTRF